MLGVPKGVSRQSAPWPIHVGTNYSTYMPWFAVFPLIRTLQATWQQRFLSQASHTVPEEPVPRTCDEIAYDCERLCWDNLRSAL